MEIENNKIDYLSIEIPLFLRLLEYAREDSTSDKDLHVLTENLLKYFNEVKKPLNMEFYEKVIPVKKNEATVAGDIAIKDVSLFSKRNKFSESLEKTIENVLKESNMEISLSMDSYDEIYKKVFPVKNEETITESKKNNFSETLEKTIEKKLKKLIKG